MHAQDAPSSAAVNDDAPYNPLEGIAFINGQPYAAKWPNHREKIRRTLLARSTPQTLKEAFGWPSIIRDELASYLEDFTGATMPIAGLPLDLSTSSVWSVVCTQSRAASILRANNVVQCSFKHVAS